MKLIEPSGWRAQPWKNGAGTTYELVREPAEPRPFDVRISVAEIQSPAPFSVFAGYRRWLYLLDGGPVTIAIAGREHVLEAPGDGIAFSGSDDAAAVAVARASRDLNFMVREELHARVTLLRGAARERATAVFAIAGEVVVDGTALARHACRFSEHALAVEVGPGGIAAVLTLATHYSAIG